MSLQKKGLDLLNSVSRGMDEVTRASHSLPSRPATAVGMLATEGNNTIRERLSRAESELESRAAEIIRLKQGLPVHRLDPKRVRLSQFADRHPSAFTDPDFVILCESIRESRGNTEPGHVRPITGDPDFDFEIASGHRRHAACLKEGFEFLALVEEMSDEELLRQMYVENTGRANLSSFERGRHFAMLLKTGIFKSGRDLSSKLAVPQPTVVKLLKYAELPEPIIEAFPDPRVIRQQWIEPLVSAWTSDRKRIDRELKVTNPDEKPSDRFRRLSGLKAKKSVIASGGEILGRVRQIHGCPALVLFKNAPDELIQELTSVLERWQSEHGTAG